MNTVSLCFNAKSVATGTLCYMSCQIQYCTFAKNERALQVEMPTWKIIILAMQDLEMMKLTIKRLLAPVKRPVNSPSAPPPPAPAPPKRPPPPPPPGLPTAAALCSNLKMQQANVVSLSHCISSLSSAMFTRPVIKIFIC